MKKHFQNFLIYVRKLENVMHLEEMCTKNHLLFVKRALSKRIIKRNKLKSKIVKDKIDRNKREYSKQLNNCIS